MHLSMLGNNVKGACIQGSNNTKGNGDNSFVVGLGGFGGWGELGGQIIWIGLLGR